LESKADDARQNRDKAQAGLDNAMVMAKDLVSGTVASGGNADSIQGGGISHSDAAQTSLDKVAEAVVLITAQSQINEPLMFCIGHLSSPDPNLETNSENRAAIVEAVRYSATNRDKITQTCLNMIVDQQKQDNLFNAGLVGGIVLEPTRGPQDERLANFLRPNLGSTELNRRIAIALRALKSIQPAASRADLFKVLVSGPEDLRQTLIAKIAELETVPVAKAELTDD
jgi:hypothetical protein